MTRRDETPGTLNNFSVAECQHKADATFLASAPDLMRQRDRLREALQAVCDARNGDEQEQDNAWQQARAILAETEAA